MNNNHLSQQKAKGFTIVELLVVISIIALLVGILVPAVQKARDSAKTTQSKSNTHQVMIALANKQADDNDRHFSTAPDSISTFVNTPGGENTQPLSAAIEEYQGSPPTHYLGIELGALGSSATVAYISGTDGVAPFCFGEGLTTSSSNKPGYGAWRYPNAARIAAYMNNMPLHSTYFAPKDTIPLDALEGCDSNSGTYCASTAAADRWGIPSYWTSNMLAAPSSYCISPAMMYDPAVYRWDMLQGKLPIDPMNLPRGFKPPSTSQAKYPSQKTWLMEHNWLQNVSNNECGINWEGFWFLSGYGSWDGCEPEHFNAGRLSEPVTVMADGSTVTFSIVDAAFDNDRVEQGDIYNNQGLAVWDHPLNGQELGRGYYSGRATDWVNFAGHTHTMDGIRGRDMLAK